MLFSPGSNINKIKKMNLDLKTIYNVVSIPLLTKKYNYTYIADVPKLSKIAVNRGIGYAKDNAKDIEKNVKEFMLILGQKPIIKKATKSVSKFKIRAGMIVGLASTLRNHKMQAFLTKIIHVVLPRIPEFQGLSSSGFDSRGNYSFGLNDQLLFPEISFKDVTSQLGVNISIVSSAKKDEELFFLLKTFGFPFSDLPSSIKEEDVLDFFDVCDK
jgi:large subunit ribosomal protein L5